MIGKNQMRSLILDTTKRLDELLPMMTAILGTIHKKSGGEYSPAEVGGARGKFDTLSYLMESKQKLDQEQVDAIKRLAQIISTDKTVGEITKDVMKISTAQEFDTGFKEATRETPPERKEDVSEKKVPEKKVPEKTTVKTLPKEERKTEEKTQQQKDSTPKMPEEIPVEGSMVPRKEGETDIKAQTSEEWKPSTFDDYFEYYSQGESEGTPPPSDTEDKEKWERLDEFVNQITGRKD